MSVMPDSSPEHMLDRIPDNMSEFTPGSMPEHVPVCVGISPWKLNLEVNQLAISDKQVGGRKLMNC